MPRLKAPFKYYEGKHQKGKHIRLTGHMMEHPTYLKLSASAKELYSYMKLHAKGGYTIQYAASMANDLMSAKTFRKARDELVAAGFIRYPNCYRARDKREPGEYEFSDRWWRDANDN